MDEVEKILISAAAGAGFGAMIAYVPRFLANRQKLVSNRALLCSEIETCREMAQTYINDKVTSPAYRLPSAGWSHSVPQILGVAHIHDIKDIQYYYLEVDALNRGLDLADKHHDNDERLQAEYRRNLLKSENITIKRYEKAKLAAEKITKWPWLC
jgi:hypothetical protein